MTRVTQIVPSSVADIMSQQGSDDEIVSLFREWYRLEQAANEILGGPQDAYNDAVSLASDVVREIGATPAKSLIGLGIKAFLVTALEHMTTTSSRISVVLQDPADEQYLSECLGWSIAADAARMIPEVTDMVQPA